ncbi:glutaredoxin domain-containing protein [Priestia koreensis]|uniref:Glutaredoxin n=1 Tax=Priestia koreensis TaxID=284581 RepID=A0A0M0LHL3_9BACI|nr:glutaredoxin domain-containing protein [Priestia koreensis]KOO50565.1 glutaredoxin [Priestia koreensis]
MKKVEVYSQPECPPCQVVKQFLTHHQIKFTEFDVSTDKAARERMIHTFQAYSTPTVKVDDDLVIGFNLPKLEELLNL